MAHFYDMLKSLRKSKGLSQSELAKILDISTSSVGMYESGKRQPNFYTEEKIAKFFGVSLDTLRGNPIESVSKKANGIMIPLLSDIKAGLLSKALENVLEYELITEDLASDGEYFALKITGDSMDPLINEGDTVIVRRQDDADTGDLVIASIDTDNAVCKKLLNHKSSMTLLSLNNRYNPLEFDSRSRNSVAIIGKVVELRKRFS